MLRLVLLIAALHALPLFAEDVALREQTVAKADEVEGNARRHVQGILDAAGPGHRVRLRWGLVFDPSHNEQRPYLAEIVALDAEDRVHGIERFFRPWVGSPIRTRTWNQGVQDGPERFFDPVPGPGGKLFCAREQMWKAGILHGSTRTFASNGNVLTETPYIDGKAQGVVQSWDPEGRKLREVTMRDGRRDGVMTEFWPGTGTPKRIATYEQGRVVGVVRDHYQDGSLKQETPFLNNARHGIEKEYAPDGSVLRERYWLDGDAVSAEDYAAKAPK